MYQPDPADPVGRVSDSVTHPHQPQPNLHLALTVAFTILSSIALPFGPSLIFPVAAIASPQPSVLQQYPDAKYPTSSKQVEVNLPPLEDQAPSINLELEQTPPPELELDDFDFWAEQCQTLVQGQQYEEGLNACNEAIAIDDKGKQTLSVWAARAEALIYQGQYADALNSIEQVLAEDSSNSLLITQQCVAYVHSGNYEEGVDSCETALATNGNWGRRSPAFAWYYRGIALQELGFMETSLWSFERSVRTAGIYSEASETSETSATETATSMEDSGAAVEPPPLVIPGAIAPVAEPLGYAEWCHTLHLFGKDRKQFADQSPVDDCTLDETIAYYEQAMQQYPQDIVLRQRQGLALEQLGDYARALAAYEQGLLVAPEHPKLLSRKCGMLNQLERYEEAFAACELALESPQPQPVLDTAYGLTQYSLALLGLERYDEALAAAERAIATHPTYGPAYTSKTVSLWYMGRNNDAQGMAQTTVNIYQHQEAVFDDTFYRPNAEPWPLFYRDYGIAYFNQGRILASNPQQQPSNLSPLTFSPESIDAIVTAYETSLREPLQQLENHWSGRVGDPQDWSLVCDEREQERCQSMSEELFTPIKAERGLAVLTPARFVDTLLNLSAIFLRKEPLGLGDSRQALEFAQVATNFNPDSFIGWYNMALAARASGQLDVAEYAFGVAQQLNPEHPYITLGQADTLASYRQTGNDGIIQPDPQKLEEAIALYTQILTDDPSNDQAKERLIEISENFFEPTQADIAQHIAMVDSDFSPLMQDAIDLYSHILFFDPTYEQAKEAILRLGNLLLERRLQLEAIATYDHLLNIDPTYQPAQIARTNALQTKQPELSNQT
ncbi:MAG: tetratricopeptide repeat protein [Cyanobacteria bacterium P01_F01_bin.150]